MVGAKDKESEFAREEHFELITSELCLVGAEPRSLVELVQCIIKLKTTSCEWPKDVRQARGA